MQTNFKLKDLTDISIKVNMCKVANKYNIAAYTNSLEGPINVFIRIDNTEDDTLGGTVLFSFRNGEQISLYDLTYDVQLVIPQEDLDKIKYSLEVSFELFGQTRNVFKSTIEKINANHSADTNNNFERIDNNLPVPDFKYIIEEKKEEVKEDNESSSDKKSFFQKLKEKFTK